MTRKVFFSFHYSEDNWRASQVRNIWIVEWNKLVSDNEWEKIKGDNQKIKKWIDDSLQWRSCTIVLIGKETFLRKRVKYEIRESWNNKKGLLWIYIHNLKNQYGEQTEKWENPFDYFTIWDKRLSEVVKTYNPPFITSNDVYNYIASNINLWVEEAIKIREE